MSFLTQGPEGEPSAPYGAGQTNWKFLLIVVVLAVIAGGGILWSIEQQKSEIIQSLQSPETGEPEAGESESNLLSECDEIQDKTDKGVCYARVAVVKEDLSICDKILNQDIKNNCYDEVKLTGRPIWDEISQENCWNRYNGETFGDTIKPVKLINARYKGSSYYFQTDEQTKIIFENESIVLEKNGSRKVIKEDIKLYHWSDYDFYSLVKLWEDAKEDNCNHFVVLSTTEPNIFLISGYEWAAGGGAYQGNYYFYLDVEKEKIVLPIEFTHAIGSIMAGNPEHYNIYFDINNELAFDIEVSCSGRFIDDSSLNYETYDASMNILFDNETIYTDSLENMCGQREFKTFFHGPNQDFSGFYFTVANMDEYSGAKKIQYFFNLREKKIEELEQITEISIDGEIKKIDKIQLPVDKEGAEMIVKSFCEPKILLAKYEYEAIEQNHKNQWLIPIPNIGCLGGATIDSRTGYTYCANELEEWQRGSFSESFSDRDTADWEIYSDEEYRFEFKYPKDWKLTEQTTNFTEEDMAGTLKKIYLISSIKWEAGDPLGIGEDWGEATAELVFTILDEESRKEEWWGTGSCWKIIFPSGIFAITSESATDVACQNYIYIPHHFDDQFFIKIFSFAPGSVWEIEEFKQALSTFKFLE